MYTVMPKPYPADVSESEACTEDLFSARFHQVFVDPLITCGQFASMLSRAVAKPAKQLMVGPVEGHLCSGRVMRFSDSIHYSWSIPDTSTWWYNTIRLPPPTTRPSRIWRYRSCNGHASQIGPRRLNTSKMWVPSWLLVFFSSVFMRDPKWWIEKYYRQQGSERFSQFRTNSLSLRRPQHWYWPSSNTPNSPPPLHPLLLCLSLKRLSRWVFGVISYHTMCINHFERINFDFMIVQQMCTPDWAYRKWRQRTLRRRRRPSPSRPLQAPSPSMPRHNHGYLFVQISSINIVDLQSPSPPHPSAWTLLISIPPVFCLASRVGFHHSPLAGVMEATGLGLVCFVVINPCVLSPNRVDLGFLPHRFYPPPPRSTSSNGKRRRRKKKKTTASEWWLGGRGY